MPAGGTAWAPVFDGINLHKGNNAGFLVHYPPRHGDSLDWYDFELNRGLQFGDEWSFNDYHQKAALQYLQTHPRETLEGDLRKLKVLFFSVEKYGGTASYGVRRMIEDMGMVLFRLMLWTAIVCAMYLLFRGRGQNDRSLRVASGVFLCGGCGLCTSLPCRLCLYETREHLDLSGGAVLLPRVVRVGWEPVPQTRDDWLDDGLKYRLPKRYTNGSLFSGNSGNTANTYVFEHFSDALFPHSQYAVPFQPLFQ